MTNISSKSTKKNLYYKLCIHYTKLYTKRMQMYTDVIIVYGLLKLSRNRGKSSERSYKILEIFQERHYFFNFWRSNNKTIFINLQTNFLFRALSYLNGVDDTLAQGHVSRGDEKNGSSVNKINKNLSRLISLPLSFYFVMKGTERNRDRQTGRQRDRQRDRQKERERERERGRKKVCLGRVRSQT